MDVLVFECSDYKITISTPTIEYAWNRFVRRVKDAAQTYCAYTSTREGMLKLYQPDEAVKRLVAQNDETVELKEWPQLWPVLFETCKYQFAVEFYHLQDTSNANLCPRVRHQLKGVADNFKFYPNEHHSGILVGEIDFLNSPGKFSFAFDYRNLEGMLLHDSLEVYVASPKLDTKNDLQQITALINQEYENYVFEYLTLTFSSFALQRTEKNNQIIWLSIFKGVVDDYFRGVRYIMSRPNNKPIRKTYHARPERIRRWSQQEEERYRNMGADAEMHYFRYEQTENTQNTRENRFVKYSLHVLGKKFREVFGEVSALYADMDAEERKTLDAYRLQFRSLEASPFFRKIGEFEGFRQESAVLQQRMGYSQVYKAWLMLKNSLDLVAGKTDIGMKKIWELYEIWCFLVMKRLIAKVLDLDVAKPNEHVRENKSEMLDTMVKSEMAHVVEFDNVKNGDVVCLEYQHTYNRSTKEFSTSTTEQRPDIVVTITKKNADVKNGDVTKNGSFVLTYLYDAKYRVQDDAKDGALDDGENIDVADYPLPDAINQMHRYRDAIYYAMKNDVRPSAKEIIGGYILFPGRVEGDGIYKRYFYQSIKKVNIGAFPLLPSAKSDDDHIVQCDLLERHLREILLENSVYEHVKDAIPQKGLLYERDEVKGNVLPYYISRENFEFGGSAILNHNCKGFSVPLNLSDGSSYDMDAIGYFMFVIEGNLDGYYDVRKASLKVDEGRLKLELLLGEFHDFRKVVNVAELPKGMIASEHLAKMQLLLDNIDGEI